MKLPPVATKRWKIWRVLLRLVRNCQLGAARSAPKAVRIAMKADQRVKSNFMPSGPRISGAQTLRLTDCTVRYMAYLAVQSKKLADVSFSRFRRLPERLVQFATSLDDSCHGKHE
ncbi:MAG: hypothetical protein QOI46_1901 [Alphaproteobacteria bacterium]|jgi:hypothetical protein|nr:hypothetical protein [Alphaproteobacteria bacterium]